MRVGHDQLDSVEAAGHQRPQERGPEALVLAVTHVEAEDFPASVGGNTDRDDNSLGHDPVPDAGFAVGGIKEHVGEVLAREGAVTELGDLCVQTGADPGHLRLRDPCVSTECLDQVVDLSGRDAVDVGLHHDSEQRLIDPAPALEQGWEERPLPQLRNLQRQIPSGRRQRAGTRAVPQRGSIDVPFERARANERGRLPLDQLLIEHLRRRPDPVGDIGELQLGEEVEQGRLI